jgi:glyoxylate reductase
MCPAPDHETDRPIVAVARVLLDAGREPIAEQAEVRVGGLDVARAELLELVVGARAIVADPTIAIDGDLLDAAGEELAIVANFAVGYDNVDLGACRARGVAVTNTPDVLTNATAELALGLTMAVARGLGAAEQDLRAGNWKGLAPGSYLGTELTGKTFGVVGLGRIGARYAELVRPLAGRILYSARTPKPEDERRLGAERAELPALLAEADVVSLHAPSSPETAGMIGAGELEAMKPTALLINTSRGSLIDEPALAAALEAGEIGAAGLDVFADEPKVSPQILAAPRCVVLPHIGSATGTARDAMARLVADNVLAAIAGREPPNRVD